ncbi:MAG: AAA family ATPase [Clostridium sp.]|nr:AAA family ATPase [Clostridium sp.]
MFERDIIHQLRAWGLREERKPLVLRGARQVGKTTVVSQFGREFDVFISLNLEHEADARAFRLSDDVKEVVNYICVLKKQSLPEAGRVLLFIDEIQNEPKAVALLRYFYEEMPHLHVIAAGSRLHALVRQRVSFPVGRVEYLSLRPCSFREYLNATGDGILADEMKRGALSGIFHVELIRRFNRYALVGGMPEAVAAYAGHGDVQRLAPIYRSLLNGYNEDVEKYARSDAQAKVMRHVLRTGWGMSGQAIKFAGFGQSSYSSREIHEALDVLQKAFLLYLDYPVTSTQVPALPALTRSPKLIWVDCGLVNFHAGVQLEYLQEKSLLDTWRGYAAEQVVAQELRVALDRHYLAEQHFWVRDKKGATAEVDFVWQRGNQLIPIEVKAGRNAHLRSIHVFMEQAPQTEVAVRVWGEPFSVDSVTTSAGRTFRLVNLPFYMVEALPEVLDAVYGDNL